MQDNETLFLPTINSLVTSYSNEFEALPLADVARTTFAPRELALDERQELSFGRPLSPNPTEGIYAGMSGDNQLIALLANKDGLAKPVAVFAAAN